MTSSLDSGDCLSGSASVLAEVWTLTVPADMVSTVSVTPVFDAVVLIYNDNAVLLSSTNNVGIGKPELATINDPGTYLVAVAAFDPAGSGPYTVVADIKAPALDGTYTGVATGTYAGAPFSSGVAFSLATSGTALSGTWTTSAGTSGTLTGTISGASFTITLRENVPCPGTYTGLGTIANAGLRLTGSFSGTDCGGSASLSFTADRF